MNYKTVLTWSNDRMHVLPFYKYNIIGYVPAGISFYYRNKEYSTIIVMNMLTDKKLGHNIRAVGGLTRHDWYDFNTAKFDKRRFVKFQNMLGKMIG